MTDLPAISNYGEYSSSNYGAHTLRLDIGRLVLWFSYHTVVAFRFEGHRYVSQNVWGATTGKHLNWIDGGDKRYRLPYEQFTEKLQSVLKSLGFTWKD